MTGEEAYQRRLAMSTTFQPVSETASPVLTATNAIEGASTTAMESPPLPRAETGEEAYLRRVAMSQQGPLQPSPPQATPTQPPRDADEEVYQRSVALSSQQTPPPSQAEQDTFEPSDSSGYNPFAPQSVPPPPPPSSIPGAASPSNATNFEERVRNSRNAAAAIAAKFCALAPPAEGKDSSDPVPVESVLGHTERYV
jgi:splicing factor 45